MDLEGSRKIDIGTYDESLETAVGRNTTEHTTFKFTCGDCGENEKEIKFFSMSLRPGNADNKDIVTQFCREENIIGQGWGPTDEIKSPEVYLKHRRDERDESGKVDSSIRNFVAWMEPDDIVFIYDKLDSQYYIVEVTGEWESVPTSDLPQKKREEYEKHDIWQFRSAEWNEVPRRNLTGSILSTTPPRPTVQKRKNVDEDQAEYLAWLQEEPNVDQEVNARSLKDTLRQQAFGEDGDPKQILTPLSFDELETIVVSYVQRHTDAVLMQNTTMDDLPDIESLLRTVDANGRPNTIGVQVTNGGIDNTGDLKNFLEDADKLYIYCSGESGVEGATEVTDREIAEYMCYYAAELPSTALVRLSRVYT